MNKPSHVTALLDAIEICGGQTELARRIADFLDRPSVKQGTVWYWLDSEAHLGAEWWAAIEHATNGQVTREQLRPDVFGDIRVKDRAVSTVRA